MTEKDWIVQDLITFLQEYRVHNTDILLIRIVDVDTLDDIIKYAGFTVEERMHIFDTLDIGTPKNLPF